METIEMALYRGYLEANGKWKLLERGYIGFSVQGSRNNASSTREHNDCSASASRSELSQQRV